MTFLEIGIKSEILKAIAELGFLKPMPIQKTVIPIILNKDTDIIALAQTGTGKTAAFGLPVLQKLELEENHIQALILSPTRELCIQIADDLMNYSKYIDNLNIVPVYGGASMETQIRALRRGTHIVVATPGRLNDLLNRRVLSLKKIKYLVLDEADEMLNMGFAESIESIINELPESRCTMLFSATMPREISAIAQKYMNKPVEITIGTKNSGAENIKHVCYTVQAKDKYDTLIRIADYYPNIYGIVFCRTKKETQEIANKLIYDGYNAEALHGDLSQPQRDAVMNKFRNKNINLLIATDVAARGIDVDDLTHVINFTMPEDPDTYNHRSGRTGRAGKAGISIIITNLKEKNIIKLIEKKIGRDFIRESVPNGREICEKQLFHLIEKIEHIEVDHSEIEPYLPIIYKKLGWLDKEDLIKRLVSVEFNSFLDYYKDAPDLNVSEHSDVRRKSSRNHNDNAFTELYINLGRIDGIYPSGLIEFLNRSNKGMKFKLGKIEIAKSFSVFGIESDLADQMIHNMHGMKLEGRRIVVKLNDSKSNKPTKEKDKKKYKPRNKKGLI
ncbi:MAG: DEAD/DEAH box helicase [Candidatus Kapaibacterium sp.]